MTNPTARCGTDLNRATTVHTGRSDGGSYGLYGLPTAPYRTLRTVPHEICGGVSYIMQQQSRHDVMVTPRLHPSVRCGWCRPPPSRRFSAGKRWLLNNRTPQLIVILYDTTGRCPSKTHMLCLLFAEALRATCCVVVALWISKYGRVAQHYYGYYYCTVGATRDLPARVMHRLSYIAPFFYHPRR